MQVGGLSSAGGAPAEIEFSAVYLVFEWDRNALECRSGPFKTTRLLVKLRQAYILASEGHAK